MNYLYFNTHSVTVFIKKKNEIGFHRNPWVVITLLDFSANDVTQCLSADLNFVLLQVTF